MQGSGQKPGQRSALLAWLAANRGTVATGIGAAAAAYVAYKAYSGQTAGQWAKLKTTLGNYATALGSLSSAAALLTSDLHAFLSSDSPELPRSLRQLNRLLQSVEVQETLASAASSIARGVADANTGQPGGPDVLDKVLQAVLSDRGRSLVGMAVGLASKNATQAFCSYLERMQYQAAHQQQQQQQDGEDAGPGPGSTATAILGLLASEQGERLMSLLITKSIKTAVSTYVDATLGYNVYDDMIASIAKQVSHGCTLTLH